MVLFFKLLFLNLFYLNPHYIKLKKENENSVSGLRNCFGGYLTDPFIKTTPETDIFVKLGGVWSYSCSKVTGLEYSNIRFLWRRRSSSLDARSDGKILVPEQDVGILLGYHTQGLEEPSRRVGVYTPSNLSWDPSLYLQGTFRVRLETHGTGLPWRYRFTRLCNLPLNPLKLLPRGFVSKGTPYPGRPSYILERVRVPTVKNLIKYLEQTKQSLHGSLKGGNLIP